MKKRKINEIIIHCTANERYDNVTVESIRKDHISRGYDDIGYHYVIDIHGNIHDGRPISKVGAHCKNHNANSIGVCYIGGLQDGYPRDTRTIPQRVSMLELLSLLCNDFPITKISGHNEYSNRSCPCFNAHEEYKHLIKTLL